MKHQRYSKIHAFTLIESFILLTIGAVLLGAKLHNNVNQEAVQARQETKQTLEEVRDNLVSMVGYTKMKCLSIARLNCDAPSPEYGIFVSGQKINLRYGYPDNKSIVKFIDKNKGIDIKFPKEKDKIVNFTLGICGFSYKQVNEKGEFPVITFVKCN